MGRELLLWFNQFHRTVAGPDCILGKQDRVWIPLYLLLIYLSFLRTTSAMAGGSLANLVLTTGYLRHGDLPHQPKPMFERLRPSAEPPAVHCCW